jgi:hypothetical protein
MRYPSQDSQSPNRDQGPRSPGESAEVSPHNRDIKRILFVQTSEVRMAYFEVRMLRYSVLVGLQWHDVNTELLENMSINQYKSDFLIIAIYRQTSVKLG